jgi:RAB protein geranylgeranyltransferase component A
MNVKGIIFLIGKTTIVKIFGEERWNSFISKLTEKDKYFSNTIWAITPVPIDKFIFFLDEMIKEFFDNDMMQYVTFGKVAAQFALSPEGPYTAYLLKKDMNLFVESVLTKLVSFPIK